MANKVVKFQGGNLPANTQDLIAGLANVTQEIRGATGGVPFLRLLRHGVFAYGPENIEPEEDSLWAVNPRSVHHGWAAWGDGELFDEIMMPFNSPLPPKSELRDYGVAWSQQYSVLLQCMNGEDTGQTVMYKGTSIGLHNASAPLFPSRPPKVPSALSRAIISRSRASEMASRWNCDISRAAAVASRS